MNLEDLCIAIRPRRDWEAVDLGILMARHWWLTMFKTWLVFVLPLLPAVFFLKASSLEWYLLFIWLIKPLLERPLLMILSQGVFGSTPDLKTVLKATPRLLSRQWLASLTWRRFSASRSMDLPVQQLEGLTGQARAQRLTVLHRQDAGPAKWLTIIGVHMESFLSLSLLSVLALLVPENVNINWWADDFQLDPLIMQTASLAYILAMGLVAPFYVACGFSLYLNRRARLEGWDLEIAFKRMVQRRAPSAYCGLILLTLVATWTVVQSAPVMASDGLPAERLEVRREFREIVRHEPFRTVEEQRVLRRKSSENDDWGEDDTSLKPIFNALSTLFNTISRILELALWAAVVVLVIIVALSYRRWQTLITEHWPTRRNRHPPETLFGLDVSGRSVPPDVSAEALRLWLEGDHRAALALLYRASLSRLLHHGLPLNDGATEQECLQAVELNAARYAVPTHAVNYFKSLTGHWRRLAYGHREPPADEAVQLCQTWNRCWQEKGDDS